MKNIFFHLPTMAIIFMAALFYPSDSFANVIRGPYLQSGTSTSIVIKWRTDTSTDSKVWYGDSPTNLNLTVSVGGSQEDHEVTVSGLTANTIYYYAVGNNAGQMAGADSDHFFRTSPQSGTSQPITAWILGDCGDISGGNEDVRDAYYNYIGSNHTDMILMLGDNAYGQGTQGQYQDAVFDVYDSKLKNTMLWSCPGNHEYEDEDSTDAPYYDIFTFPVNGEAGGVPSNTEQYYSFDYGNIHIISLDSHDEERDSGSAMLNWLEYDLGSTTQEWVVVIFHHPPYSRGSHNSDDTGIPNDPDEPGEFRMIEMRENVLPICEDYGVDLILSGHSHSYERSKLIHGHYGLSCSYDPASHDIDGGDGRLDGDGAYEQNFNVVDTVDEGTVYIVTGSSSKTDPMGIHPVMYYWTSQLGSTIMEVNGSQMDVKFLNDSSGIEDYLTLLKPRTPLVSWTNPEEGDLLTDLNPISFNVDASDSDGNVAEVEFFVDGTSVGTDTNAPYSLNWTPPNPGNYTLKATVTDNDSNTNSAYISITIQNGTAIDISSQINSNNDDAEEETSNGSIDIESSDLEMAFDGSNEQIIGMRFNNINIPSYATVTHAYIQFTVDETDSGTTNLTIKGGRRRQCRCFFQFQSKHFQSIGDG